MLEIVLFMERFLCSASPFCEYGRDVCMFVSICVLRIFYHYLKVLSLRNRLILRLDVPVHDSEKAGLGISVKGKVTVGSDPQDLGIFIKSVLHGGAASRDGRSVHYCNQLFL